MAALLLLLAAVPAEAQRSAQGNVVGRVVDSGGGPLPGAFVTLRSSQAAAEHPEREAIADDHGRFRFIDLPAGAYRLAAHLVAFQLVHTTIEVIADRDTEASMVLALKPPNGCVNSFPHPVSFRTRNGEPLPTAFVTVSGAGERPRSEVVLPTGSVARCFTPTTTDRVTLDVLGYGEHIIKRAGVDPKTVTWDITVEPTPASLLGRTARTAVTAQIRGRVFDEPGASIPDASVAFEPMNPSAGLAAFHATADSRGRFDFAGVRPGAYRITVKALGFDPTVIVHEIAAGIENDITLIVRRRSPDALPSFRRPGLGR